MLNDVRVPAPELPADLHWFNTPAPLTLAALRGKVVLLDFWTGSSIACQQVLPDLRYLTDKYRDGLVVIGVHSPRFPHERDDDAVQKAVNRLHIRYPVVNDPERRLWHDYGVPTSPSQVVVDAGGNRGRTVTGVGQRRTLDELIADLLETADQAGIRNYDEIPTQTRREPFGALSFPGKLLATGSRLFISNSGRNTLLETTHDGLIRRVFGSATPGLIDGRGEEAAFNSPQGLAGDAERLYVADTGNHLLRAISLATGEVETLAGTGEPARHAGDVHDTPRHVALHSPWDLVWHDGVLYIAMAGAHQIWSLHFSRNTLGCFAGSGQEGRVDAVGAHAAFAQPSGLCVSDTQLYIADSGNAALRAARLDNQVVSTLVGAGPDDVGDVDGAGEVARLQYPLGVAYDAKRKVVWVLDSYNQKLKRFDPLGKRLLSVTLDIPLNEPGGLSLHQDTLWIANTNAHQIVRIDLETNRCTVVDVHD